MYMSNARLLPPTAQGRSFFDFVRARDERLVRAWLEAIKGWDAGAGGLGAGGGFGYGRFGLVLAGRHSRYFCLQLSEWWSLELIIYRLYAGERHLEVGSDPGWRQTLGSISLTSPKTVREMRVVLRRQAQPGLQEKGGRRASVDSSVEVWIQM
jgi:hypothetical protein